MLTKNAPGRLGPANTKGHSVREDDTMPLTLANPGEEAIIRKVGGKPEVKKHLENLGFVAGGNVTVITMMGGNVIVNVKEARVAISKEMAQKILI